MNERRLRSRREDDEFEKRISKRFCVGIFIKDKERNEVNDEPTAPLSYGNEESTATACDNGESIATACDANGESTTTACDDKGESTTTACDNNGESNTTASADIRESNTTASADIRESTTTASDANGKSIKTARSDIRESTTTASDANGKSITIASDYNRESTTTASDANGKSITTASDEIRESTTTASDANGKSITTASDDIRESTTTASDANGKSITTASDEIRESTTTASDANGKSITTASDDIRESTTTASDANGKSITTASDDIRESTTTASDANGKSITTASDDNREPTTTASDVNREPTTTASDANRKSTTTASNNVRKSTATASDENTASVKVGKKGATAITRQGIKEATMSSRQGYKKTDDSSSEANNYITPGAVVWAVYGRKPTRYIGIVIPSIPRVQVNSPHYRNIYWFGENTVSKIPTKNINHFQDLDVYKEIHEIPLRAGGITEAVQVICDQHKLIDNIAKPRTLDQFISWIEKEQFSHCDYTIPTDILKKVEAISNHGIVIDPEDGPSRSSENVQMTNFAIDFEDRDPTRICLGCREVTSRKEPHPLVDGFLCRHCYMRVIENHMVLRLNQKYFRYCSVCGWLDKYVFCKTCKRVICRTCIMFWFEEEVYQTAAQNAFRWSCIFCVQPSSSPVYNTKLVALDVNANTQVCSLAFEEKHWLQQSEVNLFRREEEEKPALRVLALFDGICTGMLALSNLGIKVEKYFASEIDSEAIMVTRCKFGDSVEQIGDVKDITSESIKQYLPIHLLIGGSPCNDLSKVNHSRKGLTDLNGSGSLFFEFYRVMKLIDDNQGHPRTFFYLFENVSSMEAMHRNTMSRFFESSPICIDAKFMAAMSRPRLFWGNIPQMGTLAKEFLLNARDCNKSKLQDHLTPNLRREATVKKIRTVTTNNNSLTRNNGAPQVTMAGEASTLSVTEIEKIFGFPEHYTDVMNLTPSARLRLLGKAWCVHVVQALFRPLAEVFQGERRE